MTRNLGWGNKPRWAIEQAVLRQYGPGKFATRRATVARAVRVFAAARERFGVRDLGQLEHGQVSAVLREKLAEGASARYVRSLATSMNQAMRALRQDDRVWVKPASIVRSPGSARSTPPAQLDRERFGRAITAMRQAGFEREAACFELQREFGVRGRESALADVRQWAREMKVKGAVNVVRGCKGGRGRTVDRWVPVTAPAREVLRRAEAIQGPARNLAPPDQTFKQWHDHLSYVWERFAKPLDLGKPHDNRAAYACERYQQLTRTAAPVVAGHRTASRSADRAAREIIARELGHSRTSVVAAYIGAAR
jgi:Integrase